MNQLHMLYKRETGKSAEPLEITFENFRDWTVVDYADPQFKSDLVVHECLEIPHPEYINWLENKLTELLNQTP